MIQWASIQRALAVSIFGLSAHAAVAKPWKAGDPVSFNQHIRPIFSNTCFACHGFDGAKREADLRLDTPEGAYAMLKESTGYAIVPGKPEESEVVKRIFSVDREVVMPPPDFHKDLTNEQKEMIRAWIEQGAVYEPHWAFSPIKKLPLPAGEAAHPIDRWIRHRLEDAGLTHSPLADRNTLLRRLSLDLTGLPPSPKEIHDFVSDTSADAYEKQVDRLLASPHYGERMAVPWLDLVRFADTVGYHGDQNVRIFPYRDYVIKAFNENMPFDQFTTEQLAGDLLENPSIDQKIATGFLRLNLMTREGGAQSDEYMAKYLGDRVRAVGAAWLGLTTGCAECHDHKFDPIRAKDYYALGAFFADIRQWGIYQDYTYTPNPDLPGFKNDYPFPPELVIKSDSRMELLKELQQQAVYTLAAHAKENALADPDFLSWHQHASGVLQKDPSGYLLLDSKNVRSKKQTTHEVLDDQSILLLGNPIADDVITVSYPLPETYLRSIAMDVLPHPQNRGQVGRAENGKFSVEPKFFLVSQNGHKKLLDIAWSQADRRTPAAYQNGDSSPLLEKKWTAAPALWEEPTDATQLAHHALFHLAVPQKIDSGMRLMVQLTTADLGRFRIRISPFGDGVPGESQAITSELSQAMQRPLAQLSAADTEQLRAAWMQATMPDSKLPDDYKALRLQVIGSRAGYAHTMVAQTLPTDKIAKTHLLPRGNWMAPGDEVQPAVPHFLPQASLPKENRRLNRLDLAHWLMDPENPLPSRTFVNRLWKQFFGAGFSNIIDDLGNQGEWPSHPELLDWLASTFQESDWNVKALVRLMVTSETYQQQSVQSQKLAEKDPYNRLVSEQSARRLDAEFIRDQALLIAGLLDNERIGGPSVKPYQPDGYYANLTFPDRTYDTSTGGQQHRRGLYTHWQRTFMHPMMAAFDAPSREICTADRFESNSPQQALALLNDPSFVEAARGFAMRLFRELPQSGDEEKIRHAFQLALSREPQTDEIKPLLDFLAVQRENFQTSPMAAAAFLKTGQSITPSNFEPAELAAWSQLCRVILNLHETITRY